MKTNLLGMSLDAMEKFFVSLGEKPYRARQVFQWIHQKGVSDFCEMTNLSKSLQAALDKKAENVISINVEKLTSFTDQFVICSADTDIQVKAIADTIRKSTNH